ncbi:MAG: hypothetical protein H8E92_03025 [SAR86 cluster bacterium]|nr:hypothetical protein [SAR86 cluster bacterium]
MSVLKGNVKPKKRFLSEQDIHEQLIARAAESLKLEFVLFAQLYTQWYYTELLNSSIKLCKKFNFTKKELLEHIKVFCKRNFVELPGGIEFSEEAGERKYIHKSDEKILNELFNKKPLEEIYSFFLDEYEHADWFETTHEINQVGSGSDLTELANYGFFGFLGVEFYWIPWTLWEDYKSIQNGLQTKRVDPLEYISKLIKNCKEFISYFPDGGCNGIDDGLPIFEKALRLAEIRLKLDLGESITADEFSDFSGLDMRTLANNKFLKNKNKTGTFMISSKDALNFLVAKIRPDKTKLSRDRNRDLLGGNTGFNFQKNFYESIWQEQVAYEVCVSGMQDLELVRMNCFASMEMGKKYIRTSKILPANIASHNRARVEWIGTGKTFNKINAPDSIYRKNIKRISYAGNQSSIARDIKYDLARGWIKEV